MSNKNFNENAKIVSEYLENCFQKGLLNLPEIRENIHSDLELNSKEISSLEKTLLSLKKKRSNFNLILSHLGNSSKEEKIMDFSLPENELTDEFYNLCVDVCNSINIEEVKPSEIIHNVNSVYAHKNIYVAIKWLGSNKIISKDLETKKLIKGPNWQKRPYEKRKES